MALPGKRWLEEVFDGSSRRLLRYLAARLRDGTEADDVAQEAYLRLLRVDDALLIRDPRSFALRVATNVAYEWGRLARYQREHLGPEALDQQPSEAADPSDEVMRSQQWQALHRVLDGLSPMRRSILLLHLRDGLSYTQIAATVGLSVSMVGKHLALGLEACREALATRPERSQTS